MIGERYGKTQGPFKRGDDHKLILGKWREDWMEQLANAPWCFQEKVDGTNMRIHESEDGFEIRGRSDAAQLHGDLVNNMNKMMVDRSPYIFQKYGELTLYGEGYGPGIQKGGHYADEKRFILFDIYQDSQWWAHTSVAWFAAEFGFDTIPVVGRGTLWDGIQMVQNGLHSWISPTPTFAEGVIARLDIPNIRFANGEPIKLKLKHCDLYEGE